MPERRGFPASRTRSWGGFFFFLHFNYSSRVTCLCLRFPKRFFDLCKFVPYTPSRLSIYRWGERPKTTGTRNHHVQSLDRSSIVARAVFHQPAGGICREAIRKVCFPCIHKSQDNCGAPSNLGYKYLSESGNLAALFPNA